MPAANGQQALMRLGMPRPPNLRMPVIFQSHAALLARKILPVLFERDQSKKLDGSSTELNENMYTVVGSSSLDTNRVHHVYRPTAALL